MTTKNLWGKLPDADAIRPPVAMLREQATLLTQMTSGLLRGEVGTATVNDSLVHTLYIIATALNNYRYVAVEVYNDNMTLYPVRVSSGGRMTRCADESAFEAELQLVLSSEHVRKVIQALLAQSHAA